MASGSKGSKLQLSQLLTRKTHFIQMSQFSSYISDRLTNGFLRSKGEADDLICSFTEIGQLGESFRADFDNAKKALSLSMAVKKAASTSKLETPDGRDLSGFMASGFHNFFPSFINLLQTLTEQNRPFSLVLHGTQAETDSAVPELSLICEGLHPCYSGNNKTSRFEVPANIVRLTGEISATGSLKDESQIVTEGIHNLHASLVFGYCENKIVVISNNSSAMTGTYYDDRHKQQIYFSDDPSIVTLTDPITQQEIPLSAISQKAFVHINPVQAALEADYYIRALAVCQSNFRACLDDIARRPLEADDTDLTPRSYLHKHVMPTLLPVVEMCCRDRPNNPLLYLAAHLLKLEPNGFRLSTNN